MSSAHTAVRYRGTSRPASAARRRPSRRARRRARLVGLTRLVVLLLVLALVVWASARVAHAAGSSERFDGTVQVVHQGDTLWGIVVRQYGSARYDVRELVDRVERLNGLHDQPLMPGDRLRLPYLE